MIWRSGVEVSTGGMASLGQPCFIVPPSPDPPFGWRMSSSPGNFFLDRMYAAQGRCTAVYTE